MGGLPVGAPQLGATAVGRKYSVRSGISSGLSDGDVAMPSAPCQEQAAVVSARRVLALLRFLFDILLAFVAPRASSQ